MSGDYWQRKDALLRQLAADRTLSAGDLAVGVFVATCLNTDSFVAWPGTDNIAEATGLQARSVTRSLRRLEGKHFDLRGERSTLGELIGGRGKAVEIAPIDHRNPDDFVGVKQAIPRRHCQGLVSLNPDEPVPKPRRGRHVNPDDVVIPFFEGFVEDSSRGKNL